jgi:hypothetical protein
VRKRYRRVYMVQMLLKLLWDCGGRGIKENDGGGAELKYDIL